MPEIVDGNDHNWQGLDLDLEIDADQLSRMSQHLRLLVLALEALVGESWETVLQEAVQRHSRAIVTPQLLAWFGGKPSNLSGLEESDVQLLIVLICRIAQSYQSLIRRAIALVEQVNQQQSDLRQVTLLRDYLDRFSQGFSRIQPRSTEVSTPLALKLLIDLLFYSSHSGQQQLGLALLANSKT